MESQNDVTNLIPKGLETYWLLFLGGGASIAILEFAYFKMPDLTQKLGISAIPPLDIASRESLLNWVISVSLLVTAAVSLLNFRLGLKYNDPKARANAWFWTAAALVFLSLDVQAGVRETIRDILTAVSGTPLYKDGTVWWLSIYAFFFGVLGTRILLDMIAYAPSLGFYLLALAGMVVGLLIEIGFIPIFEDSTKNLILQTAVQAGSLLFFFLSVTLFARRQVFRDPEVALNWFAKVWKQSPMIQAGKAQQQHQTPSKPAQSKSVPPTVTASGTPDRPLVQQSPESIPLKPTEKDDGFDLAKTA